MVQEYTESRIWEAMGHRVASQERGAPEGVAHSAKIEKDNIASVLDQKVG